MPGRVHIMRCGDARFRQRSTGGDHRGTPRLPHPGGFRRTHRELRDERQRYRHARIRLEGLRHAAISGRAQLRVDP